MYRSTTSSRLRSIASSALMRSPKPHKQRQMNRSPRMDQGMSSCGRCGEISSRTRSCQLSRASIGKRCARRITWESLDHADAPIPVTDWLSVSCRRSNRNAKTRSRRLFLTSSYIFQKRSTVYRFSRRGNARVGSATFHFTGAAFQVRSLMIPGFVLQLSTGYNPCSISPTRTATEQLR